MISKATKLLSLAAQRNFRRALRHGTAAGTEHIPFLRSINPQLVVDVGANKGQFSVAAAFVHPRATIVAFEPLPRPAKIFRAVFAENPNVRLVEAAVGRIRGKANVNVSAREDSSSLLSIGAEQVRNFPGTHAIGVSETEIAPLHQFLEPKLAQPALLKIDVQGYELEVLRGTHEMLRSFRWIYAELSFVRLYEDQPLAHDIIAYLAEREFSLSGVYNLVNSKAGSPLQADFAFERQGDVIAN